MMVVPGALTGGRYLVNYSIDTSGLVKEVWILQTRRSVGPALADHAGRRPRPGPSIPAPRSGPSREQRAGGQAAGLHQDLRLPDERLRLGQDGRRAACRRRLRADRERRRGRPDPVQHLLGAREGAGEGVQRPRPGQAPEGARRVDRRRRLRRQPGRRGDHRARAVRRSRLRAADAAPPAGHGGAPEERRPGAGRHQLSRDREVRPPAAGARRRADRVRLDHGRLLEVLLVLRRPVHARRGGLAAVRRRAGRDRRPRRPGRARGDAARPERQRLPRRDGHVGRDRRLRDAARVRRRDPGDRAHPLHHQPPEGIHAAPDRRLRPNATSSSTTSTCRCSTAATGSWRR